MKIAAQTLLVLLFVVFFSLALLASTLKFQILDYTFWTGSFQKHNVYQNLAQVIKGSVDAQVGKEGGNKNDVTILTDLVTPANTADFVDHNLLNLLNFMNGKTGELKVYVPIAKVPKGLLPKNIATLNDEMTLTQLSQRFNIIGLDNLPFENLRQAGLYIHYLWLGSVILSSIVLVLLILTESRGTRFIATGLSLVFSGFVAFLLVESGRNLQTFIVQNYLTNPGFNQVLVGTVIPPVLGDIVQTWIYIGLVLVFGGALLFFVRKPRYNKPK